MFDNLQRNVTTYYTEAVTRDYLIRGRFQPLGGVYAYLNDRSRRFGRMLDVELLPLAVDRQAGAIKQEEMTVNMDRFLLLSFLDKEQIKEIQIIPAHRPVILFLDNIAVQGEFHINADAKDQDLLDETRDFYPLTNASIYPIYALADKLTRQVPLCFVNKKYLYAYQVRNN